MYFPVEQVLNLVVAPVISEWVQNLCKPGWLDLTETNFARASERLPYHDQKVQVGDKLVFLYSIKPKAVPAYREV